MAIKCGNLLESDSGFKAAHKKKPCPHPAIAPMAALLSADLFQDTWWRNGSIPHHSLIFLAWHSPFWLLTPKGNWLGCCLAHLPRKGGWGERSSPFKVLARSFASPCKVPFIPHQQSIALLGPRRRAAAWLSWGQAGRSQGMELGRRLAQHVSDVLLWVLSCTPLLVTSHECRASREG